MATKSAQINMALSYVGMDDFRNYLDHANIKLLMIREPYVSRHTSWAGCRIFHNARLDGNIWTMTLDRGTKYSAVQNVALTTSTCTLVEITDLMTDHELMAVNCYFRYSEDIDRHLNHLDGVLRNYRDKHIVIAADANARSTL